MTIVRGCGVHERNPRQFAAQIGGIALAVLGVVQDGVDVMEDVPLVDGRVVVVGAELFERPVGDVLAGVGKCTTEGSGRVSAVLARAGKIRLSPSSRSLSHLPNLSFRFVS